MGICASCLGGNRHESPEPESSRLLDDDPYQAGYGYGALNHAQQASQPDPEYVRREREALESICQRTSDSVIDIWSLQPQPHLLPQATLHTPISASPAQSQKGEPTNRASATRASPSSRPSSGADGNVPKHWGEVVVNPNKKRSRPDMKTDIKVKHDVFGVLNVN